MTNLKVWWVLTWDKYYPEGALRNVYSVHNTEEEANSVAEGLCNRYQPPDYVEVANISNMIGLKDE